MFSRRTACLATALALTLPLVTGCSGGGEPVMPDAAVDAGPICTRNVDCDDHLFCTGTELCLPSDGRADAHGCVSQPACPTGMVCDETTHACTSSCATTGDADHDGVMALACGGTDCDDADANRFPANPETCDAAGHDEDCDPTTFGDRDADGDGVLDALCCNGLGTATEHCGVDCDDMRNTVYPGNSEVCDSFDNDCDMAIDEGVLVTFHADADGDLFGNAAGVTMQACVAPTGYVLDTTDCDDAHAMVHPGAGGVCNCGGTPLNYDHDGDGAVTSACGGSDCDDTSALFRPGAMGTCDCAAGHTIGAETCDGRDEDCNGTIDDAAAANAYCVALAMHGTASCSTGACGTIVCDAGYYLSGSSCIVVPTARPIAPMSGATATTLRPRLRWDLGAALGGAHVEICSDRACTTVLASFDATGSSGAPTADLPVGVVYWRVYGLIGGTRSPGASATWELFVGRRSAAVDGSWGRVLDVDGDGLADVLVANRDYNGRVFIHRGATTGPLPAPSWTLSGTGLDVGMFPGVSPRAAGAGDVDGDGFADLVFTGPSTGSAYVYYGAAGGPRAVSTTLSLSPSTDLRALSATGVGDVDGDGYADLAVGLALTTSPAQVRIFRGGPSGIAASAATTLTNPLGPTDMSAFGVILGGGADFDGDGYSDVVVGGGAAVYVYRGSSSGLATTPSATLPFAHDSVAVAGDPDGDGYPDLVVGSSFATDSLGMNSGVVRLFRGGAAGLSATPARSIDGPRGAGGNFGTGVAGVGDLDGDGYDDVVVTSYGGSSPVGALHAFRGGASGLSTTAAWTFDGIGGQYGIAVAGAGDTNGDHYADVVVGAPQSSTALLYLGGAGGLASMAFGSWNDAGPVGFFGTAVY